MKTIYEFNPTSELDSGVVLLCKILTSESNSEGGLLEIHILFSLYIFLDRRMNMWNFVFGVNHTSSCINFYLKLRLRTLFTTNLCFFFHSKIIFRLWPEWVSKDPTMNLFWLEILLGSIEGFWRFQLFWPQSHGIFYTLF